MTAPIVHFTSLHRERRLPCPCRPGWVCPTHRCIDLAEVLRAATEGAEGLLVPLEQHLAVIEHALGVLDSITGARPRVDTPETTPAGGQS